MNDKRSTEPLGPGERLVIGSDPCQECVPVTRP